jgi:hypothetical protein
MLVRPLKRERTELSRGRLNIRVAITEFYCDRPAGLPGFSLPGAKAKAPPKRGLLSMGL